MNAVGTYPGPITFEVSTNLFRVTIQGQITPTKWVDVHPLGRPLQVLQNMGINEEFEPQASRHKAVTIIIQPRHHPGCMFDGQIACTHPQRKPRDHMVCILAEGSNIAVDALPVCSRHHTMGLYIGDNIACFIEGKPYNPFFTIVRK